MNTYSVRAIFDSFQGEGSRSGCRAIFVRFSGCNMWDGDPDNREAGLGACAKWCDADFRASQSRQMTAEEIADCCDKLWPTVSGLTEKWVVLTGGEPLLQADITLVMNLQDAGFSIGVETNGTVIPEGMNPDIKRYFKYVCVSPQLSLPYYSTPNLQVLRADDLKISVNGANNVNWDDILNQVAEEGEWRHKYVVPVDPIDPTIVQVSHLRGGYSDSSSLETAVSYCLHWVNKNPDWRMGIQMQKVLNLE